MWLTALLKVLGIKTLLAILCWHLLSHGFLERLLPYGFHAGPNAFFGWGYSSRS